ncbi:MAG TPA: hypothetical protein VMJ74_16885 [Pseudomonadales bacterium]|nr:hypothetical protein [Pseudomonadales bacterium]
MKSLVAFMIAIPLTVELLGAALAIRDARRAPDARAAAAERLALPLLAWGALWWWIGAAGWDVMFGAMALVVVAHVLTFYATRALLRRPRFQTNAVDTDETEERAPATMGIGKGERNLSPGRSTGG